MRNLTFNSSLVAWALQSTLWISSQMHVSAQEKYAVLIGVETYDNSTFSNLEYAADDAEHLGTALESLGYKTTVMTSESRSSPLRPSTPGKIANVIKSVIASCSGDDTILISLSGHGVQFSDEEILPSGVRETYFCPGDADLSDKSSLVKISDIVNFMNRSPARRRLLLVDACQEQVLSSNGKRKGARKIQAGSVHENLGSVPGGIAVLFSCSSGQFSWEHKDLNHSVFTHHLIRYLSGKASQQYYESGRPHLNGLVSFTSKFTNDYVIDKNLTPTGQHPVLRGSSADWVLGAKIPGISGSEGLSNERFAQLYLQANEVFQLHDDPSAVQPFLDQVASETQGTSFPLAVKALALESSIYRGAQGNAILTLAELATSVDPGSAHTELLLGIATRQQGDIAKAISHFEHAIRKNPLLVDAHLGLVWANSDNWGGDREKGADYAESLTKRFPRDYRVFNAYGTRLFNVDRWDEGLFFVQRAIELSPSNPLLWNNKGYGLAANGKQEDALDAYQKAGELAWHSSPWLLTQAAEHCISSTPPDYKAGKRFADRAIELDPSTAGAWASLAQIHKSQGNPTEALETISIGLAKAETRNALINLIRLRCEIYLSMSDIESAERDVESLQDLSAGNLEAFVLPKASVLVRRGKTVEADRLFGELIAHLREQSADASRIEYWEEQRRQLVRR